METAGWAWFLLPGVMLGRAGFRPRYLDGPEPSEVAALNRLRAVAAVVVGTVVWVVYSTESALVAVSGSFAMWLFGAVLVLPAYLLVVAVLVLAARERRGTWRRMLRGPLASILTLPLLGGLYLLTRPEHGPLRPDRTDSLPFLLQPVFIYAGLQAMLCAFTTTYYVWVHAYRAIDGSPLLRPLVTPLFAWLAAAVNLSLGISTAIGVPRPVSLVTSVGGAALVTLLAGWEYRRVAAYHGISFRSPVPVRAPVDG